MNTQHTPGPWVIKGQDIIGSGENSYICTWSGRSADAQLIAAAPDLLELAYAIVSHFENSPRFENRNQVMIKTALEVIKKARGEP